MNCKRRRMVKRSMGNLAHRNEQSASLRFHTRRNIPIPGPQGRPGVGPGKDDSLSPENAGWADYFSLARGEDSSSQRSVRSWYIISIATGLIPWTHGWWAITALL